MQLTITEALAEIKTIGKRIASKRQFVKQYLGRQEQFKDPLAGDGGSVEAIRRERQAIGDLERRLVAIRTTIQQSNLTNVLTVNGTARTVAEWLTWRKEVAPGAQQFIREIASTVQNLRSQAQGKGISVLTVNATPTSPIDLSINVDEKELAKTGDDLETVLGALDGQLSLKNATTTITIPD